MKKFTLCLSLIFLAVSSFSQAGSIDYSFGSAGRIYANVFNLNAGNEVFNAVAIQADGKIIAAGTTQVPSAIFRFNANGTRDNTFNGNGVIFCYNLKINAIAIQADGKIIVGGSCGSDFGLARYNINGTPDNSFGSQGRVVTSLGPDMERITALAIQPDGKIVAAGVAYNGMDDDFAVARYNSNGTLDTGFDDNGFTLTPIGSSPGTSEAYDQANAVAIQPDGKIVVAGYSHTDFAVVRYTSVGQLDHGFDGDGKLTTDFGSSDDQGTSVAIQPDGKIVVAGFTWDALMGFDFAIARYTSSGSLDNSFDGDGKVTTDLDNGSIDRAMAMCLQSDGKIILAGYNEDFALARYQTNGALDNSFGTNGIVLSDISTSSDFVQAIALSSTGKIAVCGRSDDGGRFDFSLALFNSNGTPDNSFNSTGRLMIPIGCSEDHATSIAVQNDGKILVGGTSGVNTNGSNRDFALYRFHPNGTPDNSFGNDGVATTAIGTSNEVINALAIQSDGKIIAAGASRRLNDVYYDFAVVRYNANGSLDNSFNGTGIVTTMIGAYDNIAASVAIQPDGKIVVAGYTFNGTQMDFAVVRYNTDGTPDSGFDGDGIVTTAVSAFNNQAFSVALQTDGKIVVGGVSENGMDADFALVRYNTDGTLDNSFDGDGKATMDFGSSVDVAYSIAIQTDGKIVMGGYSQLGSVYRFAAARFTTNGTPDNAFDGDGKVTTEAGLGAFAASVAIQADGKILLAGDVDNGNNMDFIVMRYLADGTLDNSFSGDGKAELNLENNSTEHLTAMKLMSDRIYLVGEMQTAGGYDFVLAAMFTGPFATTLPLHFVDFNGKLSGQDALLSWETENESNTREFIVERSTDGSLYRAIGSMGAANQPDKQFYHYTDNNVTALGAPVVYYRLKQIDIDNRFVYSRIVALPLDKTKNLVNFYPNPVITEAVITITVNRPTQVLCRIVDNNGRTMKSTQWNLAASGTSLPLDLSSLASGVYYVELTGEGVNYRKQFLKQ